MGLIIVFWIDEEGKDRDRRFRSQDLADVESLEHALDGPGLDRWREERSGP